MTPTPPRPGVPRPPRSRSRANAEPAGLPARRTATAILQQVIERKTPLDQAIDSENNPHFAALDQRDRALVRAILGQALRRRGEIETALNQALDRPLPPGSSLLSAILHVAAAQILFLDVPDHAAVNIAVAEAASDRRTGRARGLVNGVLRRLVRERDEILARPEAAKLNTPGWLYARWEAACGEATAAAIAAAHLKPPSLDISAKAEPELWAKQLGGALLPTGTIRLSETQRVFELPGYEEGAWWVQDAAAALIAKLLGDVAGKRVADLCAAPGGKTAALAVADAQVTAVDISRNRLKRLAANLNRLKLEARLECADVLAWQPDAPFEAVLLDAPCTATGTIRRHPDIAWLKTPEDLAKLSALQAKLLDRAAALVRQGGVLVFCTCSLEPEEGEAQIAPFLRHHSDFSLLPIEPTELAGLTQLITPPGYLRTLPCHGFGEGTAMHGMDGFFAARFSRN
ncbi:MAG: RsmB/NOP family class I SAM-dependent RNA methyltransferase [Propylenella sp.]